MIDSPQTQLRHGFRCFTITRHRRPQDERIIVHTAHTSSDHARAQDEYFKRPHPTIIDGDMWLDSGWFLGDFGVVGHLTRD